MPPNYTSTDLIKAVKADGWVQVSQRGSHVKFKHAQKPGIVVIPHPKKNIPSGTAQAILKMAGLK